MQASKSQRRYKLRSSVRSGVSKEMSMQEETEKLIQKTPSKRKKKQCDISAEEGPEELNEQEVDYEEWLENLKKFRKNVKDPKFAGKELLEPAVEFKRPGRCGVVKTASCTLCFEDLGLLGKRCYLLSSCPGRVQPQKYKETPPKHMKKQCGISVEEGPDYEEWLENLEKFRKNFKNSKFAGKVIKNPAVLFKKPGQCGIIKAASDTLRFEDLGRVGKRCYLFSSCPGRVQPQKDN